uniref:Uncharacterized protein n=1 Tax=Rhizobium rhizogenes TaxID=359 RepID=A0A7S5DSU4_RHIRH|nr:hypothetical protein pC5.7c_602 [Rhizobium rhizogenes]QCL09952.1 hypothetical protein pC5.8b_462 [Rhizobium rhizogenes]
MAGLFATLRAVACVRLLELRVNFKFYSATHTRTLDHRHPLSLCSHCNAALRNKHRHFAFGKSAMGRLRSNRQKKKAKEAAASSCHDRRASWIKQQMIVAATRYRLRRSRWRTNPARC